MTDVVADAQVLVLDAMCLSHFARAERFDSRRDEPFSRVCWMGRIIADTPTRAEIMQRV